MLVFLKFKDFVVTQQQFIQKESWPELRENSCIVSAPDISSWVPACFSILGNCCVRSGCMPNKCSIRHGQFGHYGLEPVGEFSWHSGVGCASAGLLDNTGTHPVNFSWNPSRVNGFDSGSHGKIMISTELTMCNSFFQVLGLS